MIRIVAYAPLPRGIKGAHTGGLRYCLFVVASSSWVLLPFTVCLWGNEPSVGAKVISPTTPAGRSVHHPPFDPEHQQFPLPLIRAEIAPETPFVALSGHTCRCEVRARGPRRGEFGVEVERGGLDDAFRKVATSFFFGVYV